MFKMIWRRMVCLIIICIVTMFIFVRESAAIQPPVDTSTLYVGHNNVGGGWRSPSYRASNLVNYQQLVEEVPWGVRRVNSLFVHWLTKGACVDVAVIDAGFEWNHPELIDNYRGGWDFINNDREPEWDWVRRDGMLVPDDHGTMVAGVIAARDNNYGIVGVAPRVNLYLLKANNPATDVQAINWAIEHEIDIICMSFVATRDQNLWNALTQAWDEGILLIASVANNVSKNPPDDWPLPWSHPDVIAVTCVDENNNYVPPTYTGWKVELSAPGQNIKSTTIGGGFNVAGGTSFAAPHVAGVAALLWSMDPFLTNAQIREILFETARDLGDPGYDDKYGYGLVDALAAVNFIAHMPMRADPVAAYDAASREIIFNVYETLIKMNREKYWEFSPGLADTWTGRIDLYKTIWSTDVNLYDPRGSWWSDGSLCLGWFDKYPDRWLSRGDVLYMLEPDGKYRTWLVQDCMDYGGGLIEIELLRSYFDFWIREDAIPFVDESGRVVGFFDIFDVEYSFERGMVQDQYGSPMWMFYEALFSQMSSDFWLTGNPEDVWTLSHLIDDSFEIIWDWGYRPVFRINLGIPFQETYFLWIMSQTWSSIVDKEFSISIGCWDGNLYNDADGDGYPDWFETWRHILFSPYDLNDRYVGTGPYRVAHFDPYSRVVVLIYNPNYWQSLPTLHNIVICYISDWESMEVMFIVGDIDVADVPRLYMYDLLQLPSPTSDPIWPDMKVIRIWQLYHFKWMKYWVKGWYYNLYYPSDYYYHLFKMDTCWADVTGIIPGIPDGIVNGRDVTWVVIHCMAKAPDPQTQDPSNIPPQDPKWISTYGFGGCDLTGDRIVNARDVVYAILHFNHRNQP
ncbi:MAG: S8 family serine peptidase [Candidatus Bathyarchaeia archaeon]